MLYGSNSDISNLRGILRERPRRWRNGRLKLVLLVLFAYRTTKHASTGVSSFGVMYGHGLLEYPDGKLGKC